MERRGAVLFDAAGTLIELREPVGATYARVAREHGVVLSANRLDAAFRTAFAQAPAMVFPRASGREIPALEKAWWRSVVANTFREADPCVRFSDFAGFFEDLFDRMGQAQSWRATPGARDLLLQLRASNWATAIVSNFDRRLPRLLEQLGLAALFDAVILCSDARSAKPEAAIFRYALAQLQMEASRAVVVGDDETLDIAGARAAGLRAIHVESPANLDGLLDRLAALADLHGEREGGSNHGA